MQGQSDTRKKCHQPCEAAKEATKSRVSLAVGAELKQPSVCYGISSYESNAMKSNNPSSGIYEAETARTLDNNGGNPSCNHGGIAVCTVGALCMDDYKGPNKQYVEQGKLILEP